MWYILWRHLKAFINSPIQGPPFPYYDVMCCDLINRKSLPSSWLRWRWLPLVGRRTWWASAANRWLGRWSDQWRMLPAKTQRCSTCFRFLSRISLRLYIFKTIHTCVFSNIVVRRGARKWDICHRLGVHSLFWPMAKVFFSALEGCRLNYYYQTFRKWSIKSRK